MTIEASSILYNLIMTIRDMGVIFPKKQGT
jgi:hypothetical protein